MNRPPTNATMEESMTKGMCIDAKIHNPEHLWLSLMDDDENWTYLGCVNEGSVQEENYKGKVASNEASATKRRGRWA